MGIKAQLKKWMGTNRCQSQSSSGQYRINISDRSDGLQASGLPANLAPWVSSYPRVLQCSDGTDLPIGATHALVTGTSVHKNEIVSRQIVNAVRDGYTPVVLSSNGRHGEVYNTLTSMYPDFALEYLSDSADSRCYNPFGSVTQGCMVEFFHQLVAASQQHAANSMLVRNYVNVCVRVFMYSAKAIGGLLTGQLNHMGLLQEIRRLNQCGMMTEQQRMQMEETANSAQSVSVLVFSIIQDYLLKMHHVSASRPSIQIHASASPKITILRSNSQPVHPVPIVSSMRSSGFDASIIKEKKCLFLNVENDVPRDF